jgi:dienelactone hydrolase
MGVLTRLGKRVFRFTSLWIVFSFFGPQSIGLSIEQPMRPLKGHGSEEHYLCQEEECSTRHIIGSLCSADRVSYYLPHKLKNISKAPVVVFLHGFFALVPQIYQHHIDHLTKQGYIVIFPQYQAGNWRLIDDLGVFSEADQGDWLKNAIRSTVRVLNELGPIADKTQIFAFGHSIGGLLALGWDKFQGPPLAGIVVANPKLELKYGLPEIVKKMIRVRELPWREVGSGVKGHVMVLGGSDDKMVQVHELEEIRHYLKNAASVSMYTAHSDEHSPEKISPDHFTPMTNAGIFKHLNWLMDFFGGKIVLDTYDFRFYFAGLDAMIHNNPQFMPNLGHWSDGHPFGKVVRAY